MSLYFFLMVVCAVLSVSAVKFLRWLRHWFWRRMRAVAQREKTRIWLRSLDGQNRWLKSVGRQHRH